MVTRRSLLAALPVAPLAATATFAAQEAQAHNAAKRPDPLLAAINAYRAGRQAFDDLDESAFTAGGREAEDRLVATTYGPPQDVLLNDAPQASSLAGVREAIRLAFEEEEAFDNRLVENALRSALAYLDALPKRTTNGVDVSVT